MGTRTARLRIELPNPNGDLRPGMFADVTIATGSDRPVVAVPDDSVIDTGTKQVVLLDKGEGRFEPRPVRLGIRGDGYVEVRDGIAAGGPRGDLGQLPDRRREQPEGGAAGAFGAQTRPGPAGRRRGEGAMIARLIAWSARNLVLVLIGTVFAVGAGLYALKTLPLDAIPGPLGRPDNRLHRVPPGRRPRSSRTRSPTR